MRFKPSAAPIIYLTNKIFNMYVVKRTHCILCYIRIKTLLFGAPLILTQTWVGIVIDENMWLREKNTAFYILSSVCKRVQWWTYDRVYACVVCLVSKIFGIFTLSRITQNIYRISVSGPPAIVGYRGRGAAAPQQFDCIFELIREEAYGHANDTYARKPVGKNLCSQKHSRAV